MVLPKAMVEGYSKYCHERGMFLNIKGLPLFHIGSDFDIIATNHSVLGANGKNAIYVDKNINEVNDNSPGGIHMSNLNDGKIIFECHNNRAEIKNGKKIRSSCIVSVRVKNLSSCIKEEEKFTINGNTYWGSQIIDGYGLWLRDFHTLELRKVPIGDMIHFTPISLESLGVKPHVNSPCDGEFIRSYALKEFAKETGIFSSLLQSVDMDSFLEFIGSAESDDLKRLETSLMEVRILVSQYHDKLVKYLVRGKDGR